MHMIPLDVKADGLAATMSTFTNALAEEVAAQAPDHWDVSMRKELAKVFATREMVVACAHAYDL